MERYEFSGIAKKKENKKNSKMRIDIDQVRENGQHPYSDFLFGRMPIGRAAYRREYMGRREPYELGSIQYDTLATALRLANLTLRELYQEFGIELQVPNQAKELVELLPALTEDQLYQLRTIVDYMMPALYRENVLSLTTPVYKVRYLYEYSNLKMDEDLYSSIRRIQKDPSATLDIASLPKIAAQLDISIHWLLELPNDCYVYANDPTSEWLIDHFCFLPDREQAIILQCVRMVIEKNQEEKADDVR